MRKIFFFFFSIISFIAFGQTVKLKGDYVLVNGNKCMKYSSKGMGEKNTFYNLEDKKIFYIDSQESNRGEHYYKIQFAGSDEIITLQESTINAKKEFITNLIDEGVINSTDCSINLANIKSFKDRYNKDFSSIEATVIINQTQSPAQTPKKGISIGVGVGR